MLLGDHPFLYPYQCISVFILNYCRSWFMALIRRIRCFRKWIRSYSSTSRPFRSMTLQLRTVWFTLPLPSSSSTVVNTMDLIQVWYFKRFLYCGVLISNAGFGSAALEETLKALLSSLDSGGDAQMRVSTFHLLSSLVEFLAVDDQLKYLSLYW